CASPGRRKLAAAARLREPRPRRLRGPRALRHPPPECQGAPLLGAGGALLPGRAAGAPGGARGAGGVERTPSRLAPGAGANAAFSAQHYVPWATLAAGRVGCGGVGGANRSVVAGSLRLTTAGGGRNPVAR